MPRTQRPGLSSVFDDMVAQNRKRFDDLYRGDRPHMAAPAAGGASPAARDRNTLPPIATASLLADAATSLAVRQLNERFGNDWRYEITDRQRDGDEVIVLCRLVVGKEAAIRTQFGRASVSGGPVAGASGGMRFRLNAIGAAQDESDAYRRAAEAALTNCIELI